MTRASASKAAADQRRLGLAAVAGMTAPVLFVAVFTVEGWRRPGYSPLSMFVSELSLGPDGGVQIANFLVTGALVFVFGRGLAAYSRHGAASRAGSVFLQIIGISLMRPDRSPPIPPVTRTRSVGSVPCATELYKRPNFITTLPRILAITDVERSR